MGDFDRVQISGQKADTKKLGLMIMLGVVLVGVLVFHFAKQGPQSAEASVVPVNFAAPGPAESNQTPDVALSGCAGRSDGKSCCATTSSTIRRLPNCRGIHFACPRCGFPR